MEVESVVNPVICLQVAVVEQEMCLVAAQEQLPTQVRRDRSPVIFISCLQVLSQFGFDRESMRVLMPREMIELYVVDADHIDFKL